MACIRPRAEKGCAEMIKEHMMCTAKRADSDEWVTGYYAEIGCHKIILTGEIKGDKHGYLDWERYEVDSSTLEHVAVKVTKKLNGTKEEFWCPNCDVYMGDGWG